MTIEELELAAIEYRRHPTPELRAKITGPEAIPVLLQAILDAQASYEYRGHLLAGAEARAHKLDVALCNLIEEADRVREAVEDEGLEKGMKLTHLRNAIERAKRVLEGGTA